MSHHPDCDVNDCNPDGITKPCNCTSYRTGRMYRALDQVAAERARQAELLREGAIPFDCADPEVCIGRKLPVLIEEIGEVGQAMQLLDQAWHEANPGVALLQERLREEPAVACAIAESLEQP